MIPLISKLLGLQRIRIGVDGPLSIRFATPPAPWMMLAGVILTALAIRALYRREAVGRRWRVFLTMLRIVVVSLVLLLLARPMIALRRNHVDRSQVVVLLDRSASMAATDSALAATPASQPARVSRWAQASALLTRPNDGLLAELKQGQQVSIWSFADGASRSSNISIETGDSAANILNPDGRATDLTGAIGTVLEQTQGIRLAGIVVLTDGRQTRPQALDSMSTATQSRGVAVQVVGLGSPEPRRDIAVTTVWTEPEVFVHDLVSIRVQLTSSGYGKPVPVRLMLRDSSTGDQLATTSETIGGDQNALTCELMFRPSRPGKYVLRIIAEPHPDEETAENNVAETILNAHDDKISVLYVENLPRYEYRYLKNLLVREPTVESSCLLLGATPGFPSEGTRPIRRFPQSVEELRPYDVVILGDVDPRGDWLSPAQQSLLVDFVSRDGGGLAFIAGDRNLPQQFRQTQLERLLPVQIDPQFFGRYDETLTGSFAPQLTVEGRQSPIFRLHTQANLNERVLASMPGWYWFARVLGPQPAASVLAVHPTARSAAGAIPLAVLGRYGAGRTFYLGSDELWRWRQYNGDSYYETFWIQTLHMLARGKKLGPDRLWRLETDRRQYELGETAQVRLIAADPAAAADVGEVAVRVSDSHNEPADHLVLRKTGTNARSLDGVFTPRRTGHFALSPQAAELSPQMRGAACDISVHAGDSEKLDLSADHEFLRLVAGRCGGRFYRPTDSMKTLAASIPDRSVQIADDIEEPLWDSWMIVSLFVTLIATEWISRRMLGLA